MTTGDVVRLDLLGAVSDQQVICSHHFTFETNTASDNDLIDKWQAACQASWLAIFPTAYSLGELDATQVWPCTGDLRGPAVQVGPGAGTRTGGPFGDETPAWFATEVRVGTAVRGRRRHGRFFPWVPLERDFTGNTLQAAYNGLLDTYIANLYGAFGSGGTDDDYRLGVFSRSSAYTNTRPPVCVADATIADVFRETTSIGATGILSTQRSRRG